jgi:hypothetical protein
MKLGKNNAPMASICSLPNGRISLVDVRQSKCCACTSMGSHAARRVHGTIWVGTRPAPCSRSLPDFVTRPAGRRRSWRGLLRPGKRRGSSKQRPSRHGRRVSTTSFSWTARCRAALQGGDWETVGRRAHSLKGSSANIFALATSAAAARLESAASTGDRYLLTSLEDDLRRETARATDYLLGQQRNFNRRCICGRGRRAGG